METDDIEAIKSDLEALTQASHKMAELLYSQQAEEQGDGSGEGSEDVSGNDEKSGNDDDDIVDADFEEVKKSDKQQAVWCKCSMSLELEFCNLRF